MQGKTIRMGRLFRHSGPALVVAMDHGVTLGPVDGLRDMHGMVRAVCTGGADAVLVHKGIGQGLAGVISDAGSDLIIHLSASTCMAADPNRKEIVSSLADAVRLGATAVSVQVNLASAGETGMLKDLGRVAGECLEWGMPLLAMMYVRDGSRADEYDTDKVAHAARVAEELGADIVKVNYTGSPEAFSRVVSAVDIPVIIAGGPVAGSARDLLITVRDALRAGAKGAAIGRNIFASAEPQTLVRVIRRVLDSPFTCDVDDLANSLEQGTAGA